ncbi:MAG: transposase [Bacteroidales bacterium]|nr:transposase [Bacteroidales bacterium]
MKLESEKSNFGTSEFKPINGRWIVERTFSWLESFRRLNRNYEQFLHTAKGVAMAACAMFMLRFV